MLRITSLDILRIFLFLVIIIVGLKICYKPKTTPTDTPKTINFWSKHGKSMTNKDKVMTVAKEISQQREVKTKPVVKAGPVQLKDYGSSGMRVVHLDLKGAPPKLAYLKEIFPLLSSIGVNGILMEYEDTFPYHDKLEILRSTYAFSSADIDQIQQLAESNNLEIIPLIQTFGHMEFVLKHNKYSHLREVGKYPNSLNPHLPESLNLVKEMLSQVLAKHRKCTWLHIGADEVFHLGESTGSKQWIKEGRGDLGQIYLKHIKEVVSFVVNNYPGLKLVLWDDMMRKISKEKIHESGIAEYISPMIWFYSPKFDVAKVEEFLTKYVDSGFRSIWFASAFKGATDVNQVWTPIKNHLENHLQWLQVIKSMSKFPSLRFQGLALTGWQRYDHFSTLCELLPVAIPSLVVCMEAVTFGSFTNDAKTKAQEILGFKNINLEDNVTEGDGSFAGVEIYHMVHQIYQNLKSEVTKVLENNSKIEGWFNHYHRKYRFGNPRNMEQFGSKIIQVHTQWEEYLGKFREQMEKIYFPDTVEEWMEVHVNPYMDPLREFVKDYKEIITLMAAPKQQAKNQ
ncbi:beta-N-acetylhexosaminidase [Pristis pectinata]|uniref:beta-N-acetylhexosaminidase n=1 Tax=Pristis pectinata TaxID=685728 RepID=UPI00223E495C|nr:beta-N-acetylhexosaminidase [Pristis pectinata]XP_051877575.1 beta-N-acetylhexosaminidase [Pristis pectinata]XP_051877576.1 beta-N-acetylhexosaminidase [Pristis pectinata]XP_051877577.1 beta-N-acetylhexosaminidase [Pristis pectinata]